MQAKKMENSKNLNKDKKSSKQFYLRVFKRINRNALAVRKK
jgi:hypothetical protein